MELPIDVQQHLDQQYLISDSAVDTYQREGYIKLKDVINAEAISYFNQIISEKVEELNTVKTPLEERDTYGRAFLQLFNLWQQDQRIRALVLSRRLASIASRLMQVISVRLYHDQALYKEGGGGITPWHADQYYWPIDTTNTTTAWIPLQSTPLQMGPLEFSARSQNMIGGREIEISDKSEEVVAQKIRINDLEHIIEPFDVGEVSFHSGWTFHRAGANSTKETRKVMTAIYMDSNAKLKSPENKSQEHDWHTWCPGAQIGQVIDTPLNPIIN